MSKLDPHILRLVRKEVKAHGDDLDPNDFETVEDFLAEVDVINGYEPEWDAKFYAPYYTAIYNELKTPELTEEDLWREPKEGGQSVGDDLMTNGWED